MAIKVANLKNIQAKFAKLPVAVEPALRKQLNDEGEALVGHIQAAMDAQYDQRDPSHAAVRDSVHAYPNKDRVIGIRVVADAKDAKGKFIGSNIEAGHKTADGGHVPAQPAFYPIYRAAKKAIRLRLNKVARETIRREWGGGSNG